jgi:hypothetical protein
MSADFSHNQNRSPARNGRPYERPVAPRRDDGPGSYPMPFGVYKTRKLRELPVSYVFWLLSIKLRSPLREHLHDLVDGLHAAKAAGPPLLEKEAAAGP